jgi:hypothetical protein
MIFSQTVLNIRRLIFEILFLLVTIKQKTLPDKKYSLEDKPGAIHIGINNLFIENFMMTSVFVLILWFLVLMTYILLIQMKK